MQLLPGIPWHSGSFSEGFCALMQSCQHMGNIDVEFAVIHVHALEPTVHTADMVVTMHAHER